jgi:3-deoxy-D-manno-octulosonic-acid transferase
MFDLMMMQTERDSESLVKLGAMPEKVKVMGSSKYDVATLDAETEAKGKAILESYGIGPSDKILLGGSTWPGEEQALIDIYKEASSDIEGLKLVLVPRHAERGDEIEALIKRKNLAFSRRSRELRGNSENNPVLLVDTTGELFSLYGFAAVVFVGKSLFNHGGQNVIEPASCGRAVVVGPNMENFPAVTSEMLDANALVQVQDLSQLGSAVRRFLEDENLRNQYGERAKNMARSKRGAMERTARILLGLLKSPS